MYITLANGDTRFVIRPDPGVQRVVLTGSFNGWKPIFMRRHADGEWFADYASFGIEYGPFGPDGVVNVPGQRRQSVVRQYRTANRRPGTGGGGRPT